MTSLAWLIPAALALGGLGLAAFLWSLKSGQYEDLEGAAWRALEDRSPDGKAGERPAKPAPESDGQDASMPSKEP